MFRKEPLLKKIREGICKANQLEVWDEQLIDLAPLIVKWRIEAISEIEDSAKKIHYYLSGKEENFSITYLIQGEDGTSLLGLKDFYKRL